MHGVIDEDRLVVNICSWWKPVDDKLVALHFSDNFDLSCQQNQKPVAKLVLFEDVGALFVKLQLKCICKFVNYIIGQICKVWDISDRFKHELFPRILVLPDVQQKLLFPFDLVNYKLIKMVLGKHCQTEIIS